MKSYPLTGLRAWVLALAMVVLGVTICAAATPSRGVTLSAGIANVPTCDQVLWHAGENLAGHGIEEVAARSAEFTRPQGPCGSYGVHSDGVWLLLPMVVQPEAVDRRWYLEIDYAPLDAVDVYLLRPGRAAWKAALGDRLPHNQRPTPLRAHTVLLPLDAPGDWTLMVQVNSSGGLLAPLRVLQESQLLAHEQRIQMLQGVLTGMALMLALYGTLHCVTLRDSTYLFYAVQVLSMSVFFAAFSGVGAQHLWPAQGGWSAEIVRLSVLVGLAANAVFTDRVLRVARLHWALSGALRGLAMAGAVGALSLAAGLLPGPAAYWLILMLVPLAMLLFLAAGVVSLLHGDIAARWMLTGWLFLALGVFVVIGVQWGVVPSNFWTINAYQFGTVFDMLAWLRVIGLHGENLRVQADLARRERDSLESLAHSDPLTGALNRRGLERRGNAMMLEARPDALVALYLVDLDDFKLVNDRFGHEAGDRVLIEVAHRVRQHLRAADLVARLGGDEFVVVAGSLSGPAAAQQLATKLVHALGEPLRVYGHQINMRASIGLALAPQEGSDCATLIGLADDAMYRHKRQAKAALFQEMREQA